MPESGGNALLGHNRVRMSSWEKRFGKRLRLMRRVREWTQEDLAADVRVHQSDISRWELGETLPDLRNGYRLARTFQCPVAVLDPDRPLPPEYLVPSAPETDEEEADPTA